MSYIFSKIYQILGFDKKIKLHRFIYYINLSFINCLAVQRNRGEWRDNWPTKFDTANPPQLIPNPCATQDSSDLWLLRVGRVGHAPTPFESETHPTCVCVCVYTGGKEIHRKEIRIASHKFSSQRQPRFLVLIFKARAAIYYSTTVRICIFSPRILEPPPVWVDSKRGLPKYYLNSRDLPPRLAFYKYFYLAWRREREICVDNGYLWWERRKIIISRVIFSF